MTIATLLSNTLQAAQAARTSHRPRHEHHGPAVCAAAHPLHTVPRVWGRFDDLHAGTAQVFGTPARTCVAMTHNEVVDVINEVTEATRAGEWAFGFLAYEAAGAFAPELQTHPPVQGPAAGVVRGSAQRRCARQVYLVLQQHFVI